MVPAEAVLPAQQAVGESVQPGARDAGGLQQPAGLRRLQAVEGDLPALVLDDDGRLHAVDLDIARTAADRPAACIRRAQPGDGGGEGAVGGGFEPRALHLRLGAGRRALVGGEHGVGHQGEQQQGGQGRH